DAYVDGPASGVPAGVSGIASRFAEPAHDVDRAAAEVVGDLGEDGDQPPVGIARASGAPRAHQPTEVIHRVGSHPPGAGDQSDTFVGICRRAHECGDTGSTRTSPSRGSRIEALLRLLPWEDQPLSD